jgi:crossover junction endodeoxyribonuclease RuvC
MKILGLDPGLSGALALIDEHGVVLVDDLPAHQIGAGRKTRAELDLASLCGMFAEHAIDHVFIERVAARPGQGVTGMFRFGVAYGAVLGIVTTLRLSHTLVTPQTWQRTAGCGPAPDAARARAGQLYPKVADRLTRKRDSGRADAILIAHHGMKALQANQERRTAA